MTESKKARLREWFYYAAIRAIKTFAQAFIACLPTTAVTIGEVDWIMALSTACVAAVLSLATSLAGIPEAASPWEDD
jgi:hypothetical protein